MPGRGLLAGAADGHRAAPRGAGRRGRRRPGHRRSALPRSSGRAGAAARGGRPGRARRGRAERQPLRPRQPDAGCACGVRIRGHRRPGRPAGARRRRLRGRHRVDHHRLQPRPWPASAAAPRAADGGRDRGRRRPGAGGQGRLGAAGLGHAGGALRAAGQGAADGARADRCGARRLGRRGGGPCFSGGADAGGIFPQPPPRRARWRASGCLRCCARWMPPARR